MTIINGVDYGNLVAIEIDGVLGYVDEFYLSRIPEVNHVGGYDESKPAYVSLTIGLRETLFTASAIYFWATKRVDALKLAKALAKYNEHVVIEASARVLVKFVGNVESEHRTLDDFYINVTEEERAATALV